MWYYLSTNASLLLLLWHFAPIKAEEPKPPHYYSCRSNFNASNPRLPYPFCNASIPLEQRLDDLLGRLSDYEKTRLLSATGYAVPRLGLPKLGGVENTHGVVSGCGGKNSFGNNTGCATSFPSGPGLGATFNKKLWNDIGRAVGIEVRAFHNQAIVNGALYGLDPNINLMRDPRWGRAQEVPGEDPYLTSEYAVHLVTGLQGSNRSSPMVMAATVKHFSLYDLEGYIPRTDPGPIPSGYCDTPGGCQRWNSDSIPPLADFVEYFLTPFREVITRAQPASIMCSYNAVYGKPTCADDLINNQLVRQEWGFEGFFVSDCTALELMQNVKWDSCPHPWPSEGGSCTPEPFLGGHKYTKTVDETVHVALVQGGIDLNCGPLYDTNLFSSYQNGAVTTEDLDQPVRRVLKYMLLLGIMDEQEDQPLVNDLGPDQVDSTPHRDLALQAARESIVLLKNDPIKKTNQPLLPLNQDMSVAFIGPHANSSQSFLSNYHGTNILVDDWTPLFSVMKSAHFVDVHYAAGARICDYEYGKNPGFPNMPCDKAGPNQTLIQEAVDTAKLVDTVVLFLGSDQTTEAENFDRQSLELAGNGSQHALLEAVAQVNPNTVVVLVHGGPVVFDDSRVPAIVDAFYPGQLGGPAIVDVLTGRYNPSGKLPYTNYLANFVEGRDIRDVDLASQQGTTHLYHQGPVFFRFGHGLSYTQFEYNWISDTHGSHHLQNSTTFTLRVRNTGALAGDVVCLAFLRNPSYSSVTTRQLRTPRAKLFGFERVHLGVGEFRDVDLELHASNLALVDSTTAERVLPSGGISWDVEIGDILNPARKRLQFFENREAHVLETNEVARRRYEEWKAAKESRLRTSVA